MSEDSTSRSARGVYGISVASELSGLGLQTLRLYERRGLLTPSRTDGGMRRYSDDDLERLQRITQLVNQGVNLAGIAQILDLETETVSSKPTTPQWSCGTPNPRPLVNRRRLVTPRRRTDDRSPNHGCKR